MPRVSVIIPTYNSATFLPEAIESVFAQTYKDYEIIVIDDGSTDNTKEVLNPYFDKIKYIYQQNHGAGSARNTGIKHSQGEYIAFLDADDIWLPEKLHIQANYLDNNPEIAMVYSQCLQVSTDGRLTKKRSRDRNLPSGEVFNILFLHNFVFTSTVVVRNRVLSAIGLFDESFTISQDRDLWLRVAGEFKVSGIHKPLCKYRNAGGSLSKNREILFEEKRRVIEKHYKLSKDLGRPIAPALYKKALARLLYRVGNLHLAQGDKKKALEKFSLSLKYSPFNHLALRHYFITYSKQVLSNFTMSWYQREKQ
ncbi:MAG: glycosyltransferase [Candidatus Brocadiales bacterium]